MTFELVEPHKALFRTRVRQVGEELGLPRGDRWRQPFPARPGAHHRRGHGKVAMLQHADAIVLEARRAAWARDLAVVAGAARHPLGGGDG